MFVPLLENSIVTFSGPKNIVEAQDQFVEVMDGSPRLRGGKVELKHWLHS